MLPAKVWVTIAGAIKRKFEIAKLGELGSYHRGARLQSFALDFARRS
jgi:hypothetical protein